MRSPRLTTEERRKRKHESDKRYWEKTRPQRLEYLRQWSERNREKKREIDRQYAKEHADEAKDRAKKWYQEYPEQARASRKAYRASHRPQKLASDKKRKALQRGASPGGTFTAAEWEEMKIAYGFRCVYCGRKMKRLSQDHLTPLSKGGAHTKHNIVPACQPCNSKKHAGGVLVPVQPLLL